MKKHVSLLVTCTLLFMLTLSMVACSGSGNVLKDGVKNNVVGFGSSDTITGEYSGLEIDLTNMLAKELGYDGVDLTAVTATTRGTVDSGTGLCYRYLHHHRRTQAILGFLSPVLHRSVTVLVEKSSSISKLEDLVGKTVGVSKLHIRKSTCYCHVRCGID